MGNLEQAVDKAKEEKPVVQNIVLPSRISIREDHSNQEVMRRLRENLAPPERTRIGSNASVGLGQELEIGGNADRIRSTITIVNLRIAIEELQKLTPSR